MLNGSLKHQYRMSEITAALNGPEADQMADADRDALTAELLSEGSRYRAALATEQEAADADPDAGTERHHRPAGTRDSAVAGQDRRLPIISTPLRAAAWWKAPLPNCVAPRWAMTLPAT